jgi:predicted NUDIX family NTP pyrophosphohydrolase
MIFLIGSPVIRIQPKPFVFSATFNPNRHKTHPSDSSRYRPLTDNAVGGKSTLIGFAAIRIRPKPFVLNLNLNSNRHKTHLSGSHVHRSNSSDISPMLWLGMAKRSAGLLMYRGEGGSLEVLLVHPGGPFWAKKDAGAWFIPKGEIGAAEDELEAAKREFLEETGLSPTGSLLALGTVRQKSGKTVTAWAFRGDCDPATLKSNTFTIEWPPRSGKQREFPEIDRAEFFSLENATKKIHPVEWELVDRLAKKLESSQDYGKRGEA